MRPVKLFKRFREAYEEEYTIDNGPKKGEKSTRRLMRWKKIDDGQGMFHCWGCISSEEEHSLGTDSIAIVEMPDGAIGIYEPDLIKFITPIKHNDWMHTVKEI